MIPLPYRYPEDVLINYGPFTITDIAQRCAYCGRWYKGHYSGMACPGCGATQIEPIQSGVNTAAVVYPLTNTNSYVDTISRWIDILRIL